MYNTHRFVDSNNKLISHKIDVRTDKSKHHGLMKCVKSLESKYHPNLDQDKLPGRHVDGGGCLSDLGLKWVT